MFCWKPEDFCRQFASMQGQDHSRGWQLERSKRARLAD